VRPSEHISLVGLSGTGKSSVAPHLARLVHRAAADLDDMVEVAARMPVAELFESEGESRFRELELQALREVLDGQPAVVATGGGVVSTPEAAELLADRTTVVWLRAAPEILLARLRAHEEARPLLADDPAGRLEAMASARNPLYEALADLVVDVDELASAEVAQRLAADRGGA
jgi:shikimate kinase